MTPTTPEINSASLTQIMIEGNLETLLSGFDPEIVASFLEKALSDENFGQTGNYSFFCKNCGGQWSFANKDERKIFEKLHKFTGCSFEWKQSPKNNVAAWTKKRSKQNVHPGRIDVVKGVIQSLQNKHTDTQAV
jgi:hypothetical protein